MATGCTKFLNIRNGSSNSQQYLTINEKPVIQVYNNQKKKKKNSFHKLE